MRKLTRGTADKYGYFRKSLAHACYRARNAMTRDSHRAERNNFASNETNKGTPLPNAAAQRKYVSQPSSSQRDPNRQTCADPIQSRCFSARGSHLGEGHYGPKSRMIFAKLTPQQNGELSDNWIQSRQPRNEIRLAKRSLTLPNHDASLRGGAILEKATTDQSPG